MTDKLADLSDFSGYKNVRSADKRLEFPKTSCQNGINKQRLADKKYKSVDIICQYLYILLDSF